MIPLVINDDPTKLLQISMSGSVGVGGSNDYQDLVLVQSLLNEIPASEGGPETKLAVDGHNGPHTEEAIRRYQQAHTPIVDGVVDVHGSTIKSLVTTLNSRDRLPLGLPRVEQPSQDVMQALGAVDVEPPIQEGSAFYTGPTDWHYKTSSSLSMSLLIAGITVINIVMERESEPQQPYTFTFRGPGVGLSSLPVGIDWSDRQFPSFGKRLWKVNPLRGKAPPVPPSELCGFATIMAFGSNVVVGGNALVVFWGAIGHAIPLTAYMNYLIGMEMGIPSTSMMLFTGVIEISR